MRWHLGRPCESVPSLCNAVPYANTQLVNGSVQNIHQCKDQDCQDRRDNNSGCHAYIRACCRHNIFFGGSLGRGTREDIKKMPLMQPTAFGWGCEWGKYGRCRSGGFPIRIGECSRKGTMGTTGLCLSSWWQRDTTCACHLTSLNCTYGTRHVTKCYCSAGLTTTGVY